MGEIELGAAAEATIQAYKELATDPAKRVALALDRTCIQFLAYVVAEGEGTLVDLAVETLALIAEAKECRPSLANTFGVLEALQSITEDEESYSDELKEKAAGLFTSLQFAKHVKEPKPKESTGASSSTSSTSTSSAPSSTSSAKDDVDSTTKEVEEKKPEKVEPVERVLKKVDDVSVKESQSKASVEKRDSFLGIHNSKAKVVTLFIKGMVNQEHRQRVEEELVRVRGLISIVFDLSHSRVTCRVKRDLSVEKLAAAVARTETLAAHQVTTNDKGEEEIIPLCKSPTDTTTTTTSPVEDLPDYLPEEDYDIKDAHSAMAPSGSFMETATTWISSASSFLQKSFYW
ncbi:armadillo repeat-containing protein 1-like [Portunus trituberculatus]|uniref:armadillo repeat-containing protein 1-like n=1 Tax=Portunus trituberculatus TaxID=210409 RepID=UPI001E1D0D8F|nr:armadillo repeat-containing protein 1-like [Portunus trituberculatus]XP_045126180.1 armadillo repeat-containing protein 1-like [Portunus trituberculatus]